MDVLLRKIEDSAMLVIGAVFAIVGIYEIALPVDQALVTNFVAALFALLGAILIGYAERTRSFKMAGAQAIDLNKFKAAGTVVISLAFGLFGIWQISVGVDEAVVQQLFALIMVILAGIFGGVNGKNYRVAAAQGK